MFLISAAVLICFIAAFMSAISSAMAKSLQSARAWRHRGDPHARSRPNMPPLHFSAEEMDLLLALARPIDQRQRDQFLQEVAAEIEAASAQTGVGPGLGVLHRVGRVVQRKYFAPPELPNASPRARA